MAKIRLLTRVMMGGVHYETGHILDCGAPAATHLKAAGAAEAYEPKAEPEPAPAAAPKPKKKLFGGDK
jgi:hypothetical protein